MSEANFPRIKMADGQRLSPKSLAQLIAYQLAPSGDPVNRKNPQDLGQIYQLYKSYLEKLQRLHKAVNHISPVVKAWRAYRHHIPLDLPTIAVFPLDSLERKVTHKVTAFVKELLVKYRAEIREVVELIKLHDNWGHASDNIELNFRRFSTADNYELSVDLNNFARAQAIQLKKLYQQGNPAALTAESLFHALPPDSNLMEDLYRYLMLKAFQNFLEGVRPFIIKFMSEHIEEKLALTFPMGSDLGPGLARLFENGSNHMWRQNVFEHMFSKFYQIQESPSELFTKLSLPPTSQEQILHALNVEMGSLSFLSKQHLEDLRQNSRIRLKFKKKLDELKSRIQQNQENLDPPRIPKRAKAFPMFSIFAQRIDQLKSLFKKRNGSRVERDKNQNPAPSSEDKLDALQRLENLALNSNLIQVNYGLIEKLFGEQIIDFDTRERLSSAKEMSREAFLRVLGTKEEFHRILKINFEKNLLERAANPITKPIELVIDTAKRLTLDRLDLVDKEAEGIYLAPDAFLKSSSFKFVRALKIYNPEYITLIMDLTLRPETMLKAYIEAYASNSKFGFRSPMDEFLSQLKIPQDVPKTEQSGITRILFGFDERLSAIYHRALEKNDERLRGTPFEHKFESFRGHFNALVNYIHSHRDQLDTSLETVITLNKELREVENTLAPDLRELTRIFESVLNTGKQFERY